MCDFIKGDYVAPGWGCCRCRVYNGLQRTVCKSCGVAPHELSIPADLAKGTYHEDGQTEVEILAVTHDEKGYGFQLRSLGGDIPTGTEWRAWTAHDCGANGCWSLK